MTMIDTVRELQTRSLEGLKTAQEQVVSYNERVADTVTGAMPAVEAPFGQYLPKPAEMVDAYYSFLGELYEVNKDFASRIVSAWDQGGEEAAPAKATKATKSSK